MIHTVFVLSDFGCRDTYAGQMKAALIREMGDASHVSIIDLTNSIPPGDIQNGAFNLMVSVPNLPAGSGVLAVVDPGVGTSRRVLLAKAIRSPVPRASSSMPRARMSSWRRPS
jgi:S-adenosylmethionine hydrolase